MGIFTKSDGHFNRRLTEGNLFLRFEDRPLCDRAKKLYFLWIPDAASMPQLSNLGVW
jgi:hypothetical protein